MFGPSNLASWPWENLGSFKYLLYGPFIGSVILSRMKEEDLMSNWSVHILMICAFRGLIYQLWSSFVHMLFLTRNRRIIHQGIDFNQIDKEWDWDNTIILQALFGSMCINLFPKIGSLPLWDTRGLIGILILHMGVSEPLYYWLHKCFHGNYLYTHFHSLHHSSAVPHPFTAGHGTLLEQVGMSIVVGIPIYI